MTERSRAEPGESSIGGEVFAYAPHVVTPLRARFPGIFARLRRGEAREALAELEALRDEALSDTEASNRATFWATLANALDCVGRSEEALAAAEKALALDTELGLERGAYFSLHSMVIILRRLGRRDEAAQRAKELLVIGEKLGSTDFADAAVHAASDLSDGEARSLLERARFACDVTLRERDPKGASLFELTVAWGRAALALGNLYARLGDLERAERAVGEVTPLLASTQSFANSRRNLGIAWFQLAGIAARRSARAEQRYGYRAALDIFDAEEDRKPALVALDRAGARRATANRRSTFFARSA